MKRGRILVIISVFSVAAHATFALQTAHAEEGYELPDSAPFVFALVGSAASVHEPVLRNLVTETDQSEHGVNFSIEALPERDGSGRLGQAAPEFPEAAAVIVLREGTGNRVRIVNGRRGTTTPKWLLLAVTASLSEAGVSFELDRTEMPLYRLGWIPDDPDLARAALPDTPSILLEIPVGGQSFLPALAERLRGGIPGESDRHYLTFAIGERLFVPGESFLVTMMIVISAVTFFILFFLSFTYGSKSEQRLRDFFRVWWLPFFFLAVNVAALYAGQALVRAIMLAQFGSAEAWSVVPVRALAGKLAFGFFFASLLVTFNQLVPFPRESFIYGYIASVVCLANIFLFTSLDFSLSVLFTLAFAIAFALYHVSNPWIQLSGLIVLALPFFPYIRALGQGDAAAVGPLFDGSLPWNLRISMFVMPFQLFMSRLSRSARVLTPGRGFHVPVLPIAALALAIAYAGYLVLAPAWTSARPLPVTVRQTAEYGKILTETLSAVPNVDFPVFLPAESEDDLADRMRPDNLISVRIEPRLALGRVITRVTTGSALELDALSLEVRSASGTAVLAASREFTRNTSGSRATFFVASPGTEPVTVEFTSPGGGEIDLVISARTSQNAVGARIEDDSVRMTYELVTSRSFSIGPDGSAREMK